MLYSAAIALESSVEDSPLHRTIELRIVLVDATDDQKAVTEAERVGHESEETYSNADGKTVRWTFRSVVKVAEIPRDTLGPRAEVFSMFLTEDEFLSISSPFPETDVIPDAPVFGGTVRYKDTPLGSRARVN